MIDRLKKRRKVLFARNMRKNPTKSEKLLWEFLRLSDYKWRRQAVKYGYILDFFCPRFKLIIEIDGESHNTLAQRQHDMKRDHFFKRVGFTTLRISSKKVEEDACRVKMGVEEFAKNHLIFAERQYLSRHQALRRAI